MGDGMFDEWLATLDAIKKLEFDMVLPGHGVPFHEKLSHHGVSVLPKRSHGFQIATFLPAGCLARTCRAKKWT